MTAETPRSLPDRSPQLIAALLRALAARTTAISRFATGAGSWDDILDSERRHPLAPLAVLGITNNTEQGS